MIRAIGLFLALLHAPLSAAEFPAFLESYCLECHDDLAKKGGLDLSRFLTEDDVMADREVWAAVHEKIESHQMPPPKEYAQPTDADRTALLAWIEDIAARPDPALEARDPGKPVLRRLTRLEYNNAIRDLFGLEMDIFAFPERLPLRDKSYFQPATGVMPAEIRVEMREYGAKYPVLCPQLGLPGDHRAEHGYRNRGDTQDFSPLLLENYLAAALTIVNAPELPRRSRVFADLLGLEESSLGFSPKAEDGELGRKPKLLTSFAPDIETIPDAGGNAIPLADFRRRLAEAHAQGLGGVFDVPKSVANQTIEGKGGLIRAAFGNRSLTINPNADLWIAAFATAKATSAPAILTNKEKGAKVFELTFDIESDDAEEGVEHLGFCLVGRRGQSGTVKLTAIFTDATEQTISRDMAEGEAGTTFVSFSAPPGEAVKKLVVDGSGFSGDYVLLDDLAVIQSSLGFSPNLPRPELGLKPKLLSASPVERLNAFADRAFRRPLSDEERATFRTLFHQVQAAGASEADAMRQAVAAVLASPALLYVEANGTPGDAPVTPLEDHELATRLALFLWASTPDEELLALAREGRLHDPAVLEAQTRRMLKDPRSREIERVLRRAMAAARSAPERQARPGALQELLLRPAEQGHPPRLGPRRGPPVVRDGPDRGPPHPRFPRRRLHLAQQPAFPALWDSARRIGRHHRRAGRHQSRTPGQERPGRDLAAGDAGRREPRRFRDDVRTPDRDFAALPHQSGKARRVDPRDALQPPAHRTQGRLCDRE